MIYTELEIPDVKLITLNQHYDGRGYFVETFRVSEFAKQLDWLQDAAYLRSEFLQDNRSFSRESVLRGLHAQPGMAKLVSVAIGSILDVAVDIRPDSPTFGKYVQVVLTESNTLYIPDGFAHGFFALEDSVVTYKCTTEYDPKTETGIRWDSVGISWPTTTPIVSEKDQKLPSFDDPTGVN